MFTVENLIVLIPTSPPSFALSSLASLTITLTHPGTRSPSHSPLPILLSLPPTHKVIGAICGIGKVRMGGSLSLLKVNVNPHGAENNAATEKHNG